MVDKGCLKKGFRCRHVWNVWHVMDPHKNGEGIVLSRCGKCDKVKIHSYYNGKLTRSYVWDVRE